MKWIGLKEETSIIHSYYYNSGTSKVWIPFVTDGEAALGPLYQYPWTYIVAPFNGVVYSIQFSSSVNTSGNIETKFHKDASGTQTGSTLTTASWPTSLSGGLGPVAALYPTDWIFNKGESLFISADPSVSREAVGITIVLKYNTYGVSK
jgi:hypothetical protein